MPVSRSSTTESSAPIASAGPSEGVDKNGHKLHKRSRSGCFTCRLRRKKCDEAHPTCSACANLNLKCEYKRPMWWASADLRRQHKERVKNNIKHTKSIERRGSNHYDRVSSLSPSMIEDYDFSRPGPRIPDNFDPFGPIPQPPVFPSGSHLPQYAPYEVDVRTERQTFVNDVPMRHDSSVSTFNAMGPPQLHHTLPTFHEEEWFEEEGFNGFEPHETFDPSTLDPSMDPAFQASASVPESVPQAFLPQASLPQLPTPNLLQTSKIPVDDLDRPLLDHFVNHVLRIIFPILEVHQQGLTRAKAILTALETNKAYLHSCLSVSAIHLKNNVGLVHPDVDSDIMRHRYEAISALCTALNSDSKHDEILDATLAMIFFHCSVGGPEDCLPDIPWSDHFQAASNLVNRLELPTKLLPHSAECSSGTPFSMSLTTWIDILGSTMMGTTPKFAHSYRTKHLSGQSSGLQELMGCNDRVMYLIAEIACLDSLKSEGTVDDITVCQHVSALAAQLEYIEPVDPSLDHPYTTTGTIRPEKLTKTMTTIFRIAARIYLCSLVPGFDRHQSSIVALVSSISAALQYIPAGPFGFDRSIVWPLLIAGAAAVPESEMRNILWERSAALGDIGDYGSFGRMFRIVQEVWRLTDEPPMASLSNSETENQPIATRSFAPTSPEAAAFAGRSIKKQQVHWRDIMTRNGWKYLLI
ncbi:hypothetical protein N7520_006208 [Penicillium odoratum]|uniref:uncharacterized protein n=1 Tax=Penicillium odoratum TaxID=1167516 RepID=UPI0025471050|nr:uncharacterized protein N7520_006208 [Penicillium odoratum]KAJ5759052.1 hypothetical protein N7520_006208 [Penicillium odoratum]